MGEMSAASTTMPIGKDEESADIDEGGADVGDFRRAFTTSLTPRLSVLWPAAAQG